MAIEDNKSVHSDEGAVDFPEAGVHQFEKGPLSKSKSLSDLLITYTKYIISSGVTMLYLTYIFWGIWTNHC